MFSRVMGVRVDKKGMSSEVFGGRIKVMSKVREVKEDVACLRD